MDEHVDASARWDLVSPSGLRRVYRMLCHVAYCDQVVDPRERTLLERYRERFRLPSAEAAQLEAEGKQGAMSLGRDPLEQRLLLEAMIDVAAADGRFEPREQKRLLKVAGHVGLAQAELVALMRRSFERRRGVPKTSPGRPVARIPETNPSVPVAREDGRLPIPDTNAERPAAPDPDAPGWAPSWDEQDGPARPDVVIPRTNLEVRTPGVPAFEDHRGGRAELEPPTVVGRGPRRGAAPGRDAEPTRTGGRARDEDPFGSFEGAEPTRADRPTSPHAGRAAGDSSLSLSPGTVVLLGVPTGELRIDLGAVHVRPDFRGLDKVPPGLHLLSVPTTEGPATLWFDLKGGAVFVKVWDLRARRFVDPSPATEERWRTMARGGGLTSGLVTYSYDAAIDWVELTVHVDTERFPPGLRRSDPEQRFPSRLEAAWKGSHRGDGQALLTEVAWSFLAGSYEKSPAAFERWLTLLKASFDAPASLVLEDPALFVLLVDLILAQLAQMPPTFFDVSIGCGIDELADALEEADTALLADAARRLRGARR